MILLPWYVRFAIDCTLIGLPFWYLNSNLYHKIDNPILIFSYFEDKRRITRRRSKFY